MKPILSALLVVFGLWTIHAWSGIDRSSQALAAPHSTPPAPIYLPYIDSQSQAVATPQPTGTTPTPTVTPSPSPSPTGVTMAGFFSKKHWTYSGDIALDSSGGVHVVYHATGTTPDGVYPGYYTYCADLASCGSPETWPRVMLGTDADELQILLTSSGQPRILFRRSANENSFTRYYYYLACDTNCLHSQGWRSALVAGTSYIDVVASSLPNHYFALDHQDRPRFLYYDNHAGREHMGTFYASCNTDCTDAENWSEVQLTESLLADPALQFTASGQPRVLTSIHSDQVIEGYSGPILTYLACTNTCESNTAGWAFTYIAAVGFGVEKNWSLDLDQQNRPRAVFYQGSLDDGTGRQLHYLWCNSDCTGSGWTGVSLGLPVDTGMGADLALDSKNRPRIVYKDEESDGLAYLWCNSGCESEAAQWQNEVIEPAAAINKDLSIDLLPNCDVGIWESSLVPALALDNDGNPHVVFEAEQQQRCHDRSSTGTRSSRIETTYHGVRLLIFPQP